MEFLAVKLTSGVVKKTSVVSHKTTTPNKNSKKPSVTLTKK